MRLELVNGTKHDHPAPLPRQALIDRQRALLEFWFREAGVFVDDAQVQRLIDVGVRSGLAAVRWH